jgi:DNA-binding MarR family transcriptional regulator
MKRRTAQQAAHQLILASVRLIRRLRAQDTQAKLTGPQASALAVIVHSGGVTLGELAGVEQVGPSAITKVAKQLQHAGLVAREADRGDRRVQRLRATAAGKTLLRAGQSRHTLPLVRAFMAMTPQEAETLTAAIAILEQLKLELPS